jgi:hypothetical protein
MISTEIQAISMMKRSFQEASRVMEAKMDNLAKFLDYQK